MTDCHWNFPLQKMTSVQKKFLISSIWTLKIDFEIDFSSWREAILCFQASSQQGKKVKQIEIFLVKSGFHSWTRQFDELFWQLKLYGIMTNVENWQNAILSLQKRWHKDFLLSTSNLQSGKKLWQSVCLSSHFKSLPSWRINLMKIEKTKQNKKMLNWNIAE